MVAESVNSGGGAMTEEQAFRLAPLALAYVGDAVWELRVRAMLVQAGERQPRRLHQRAVALVRAAAQADRVRHLMDSLTEREQQIVRRGRNAKSGSVPRGASVADYRASTSLEALLGYLWLSGQSERLQSVENALLAFGIGSPDATVE